MKKERQYEKLIRLITHYTVFFLLIAFVVTCSLMLFMTTFMKTQNIALTSENLNVAAKLTFINVVILSVFFSFIDGVRRKRYVEEPVNRILQAAEKVMQGDYSVRIPLTGHLGDDSGFDDIAECFNKMTAELSGVETLRTDFVANVSHEMKTPLAAMQNYGTLLQAPDLTEEERMEYAKGVSAGARRLTDMMTNILKLNRLENQQIFPQTKEFNLGEQLCECILQFENVWEEAGIEIVTNMEENVMVKADEELLSLVWNNLLSNAFKFTDRGGCVSAALSVSGQFAVVKISDTGCGMSPEVGAHIFEKFYQGDTSRAIQGNGLGLALVRRVIDITQGEISVESAKGKGTTFTVKIRRI